LKADNILVETSGHCKITDFGISKRTDDNSAAFTAMQGTVFWMAPEVISTRKKGYNFKIDIWSVGCVVLEMWAGQRPWKDEEAVAVMFKVTTVVHLMCEGVLTVTFLWNLSSMKRNFHHLFRRTSSCQALLMTSEANVSRCECLFLSLQCYRSHAMPETRRTDHPQQSCGSIRI
jgi:serine/threonine protein kinase